MDENKKTYEGLFLLDAGQPNFEAASEPILNILNRNEAEILSIKPWDERRLAYEIAGRKQGFYVLTYFKADPQRLAEMEHDWRLEERVLRAMVLRRDRLTDQQIDAETPATAGIRRAAQAAAKRESDQSGNGKPEREIPDAKTPNKSDETETPKEAPEAPPEAPEASPAEASEDEQKTI